MKVSEFEIADVAALVGRSITDSAVVAVLGPALFGVRREPSGSCISLPSEGIDIMLDAASGNEPPHDTSETFLIWPFTSIATAMKSIPDIPAGCRMVSC